MGGLRWVSIVVMAGALAGCSVGTASYDDALDIAAPTFSPTPPSPEQSPQLDALVVRDTDGLVVSEPPPNTEHLREALAAVEDEFPGIESVSDLYFDDENVWMTIRDPESPRRSRGIFWRPGDGLYVGEAEFAEDTDDAPFPISAIRVDAIGALIDGLVERYPTLHVDLPRLSTSLSYELGLSWRMDLVDSRGTLATIFADLDGTVTVVDLS
jgi:hypothetical protein